MPFDPVRDAVLNSPIASFSSPLPSSLPPTPQSPSRQLPNRRPTGLAALLNDDPPRTSKIAHLLHNPDDRLAEAPSIRKMTKYSPINRISAPESVLRPMSQAEINLYKTYQGKGTLRLAKRKRSPEAPAPEERPQKRHAGDVGVVVDHYNTRPEVGVAQRETSPIIGLKSFNNWVKSVLISRFGHPALQASKVVGRGPRAGRGKVLDMGCGKGGDLTKWAKARVAELFGADIAAVSVDQARSRYQSSRNSHFEATFAALDCYSEPLSKAFSPAKLATPFDVVSLQFCMHYAFESIQKARCMLDNVSKWLRVGGVFVGTIPNAEQLLHNLDEIPPDSDDLSFGNSVYKIRFEDRVNKPVFGHKYWFYLQDAVENVPEYVVRWDNFVQLAAEYGLHPVYKEEFHDIFSEHQDHPEFGPLMVRMKVVDANGESSMDEAQWEAANIYIAFAFEKR
ncbi:mRNA cap guanine-N7 methyltransferase [Mycena indigotica]|uniref:mRNA cap guanine-N(7) methyltransferase n=1 Tax=Mycena indigotica TaxID=2126181 RepID=A0A8H6W0P2_9AGAR|nr:mRNA cap guanine-N7 methyltransferase [Mycena indigotica]KAF7295089.1 mRNA cap guanine-N7 methyltransferase [Mycena indigotica]